MTTINTGLLDLGAALSCETRVRLLVAVSERPRPVGELARLLGVAQSTCSHHIEALARAQLVEVRPEGGRHLVYGTVSEIRVSLRAA